jgi:hypothetical protein
MFGRTRGFEFTSQYLPTFVDQVQDTWKFRGEIHDLPLKGNEPLYSQLEQVLTMCTSHLEGVMQYAHRLKPTLQANDNELCPDSFRPHEYCNTSFSSMPPPARVSLRGQSLQVIVSIADYVLQPGQSYEGNYHLDGMPNEDIIATIDITLHRDEEFQGGALEFKRGFLIKEVMNLMKANVDEFFLESCPLGKVETKPGRVLVFPNTHIHRVCRSINVSANKTVKRRNIILFVVNPSTRLITKEDLVCKQPQLTVEESIAQRDVMMRMRLTQHWNVLTNLNPGEVGCF